MKINKTTMALLFAGLSTVTVLETDKAFASEEHTGQFTFEDNTIKNKVTGKIYPLPDKSKFVDVDNSTALRFDEGSLKIPLADLGIDDNTETVTVSFGFIWNGENNVMPIGFERYDTWLVDGYFGFNTANGDVYGIANPFVAGEYTQVKLVFNKGDYTKNEIYINGVKKVLSQQMSSPFSDLAVFNGVLNLSGFSDNDIYNLRGSIIDEVNIYHRQAEPKFVEPEVDDLETQSQKHMVKVIGTFEATTLDVKIPATTSFLYNPNIQEMTAQRMGIFNDTNAPVYMKLSQIAVADESTWKPTLVAPNRYTDGQWRNLTKAQTQAEVALGLHVLEDEDWLRGLEQNNLWSVTANNTNIGIIKNHTSIEAEPTLKAGTSLPSQSILTANYVFEFGLAE